MSIVYLNGAFLPREEATVSVMDRGFLFGDGIYEVIPVFHGKPFRLQQHLDRLSTNLDAVRIPNPHSDPQWAALIEQTIEQNGGGQLSVYLQVTRGAPPLRDHGFAQDLIPTVFINATSLPEPDPNKLTKGVKAISMEDIRWKHCNIKAIALLPNVLMRQQALDEDAAEAILVRDGQVTEGAASNVFMVTQGNILTPPKSALLLPGITRDLVLELAQEHGFTATEQPFGLDELARADEIWLTSSLKDILPVVKLNNHVVGDGQPGNIWKKMSVILQTYKAQLKNGE